MSENNDKNYLAEAIIALNMHIKAKQTFSTTKDDEQLKTIFRLRVELEEILYFEEQL